MASYRTNVDINVPVVLTNATTGLAHTGVLAASVTVSVIKSDGTTATFTPTGPQWVEENFGAFALAGVYLLTIPAAHTDVDGPLWYGVQVSGDDLFNDTVDLSDVQSLTQRILSLSYDNVVEDGQVYDASGKLLSSDVWFYNSAANAATNDHVTGLLFRYNIEGAYDGQSNCTLFRMRRIL
jgi:hypothetical protein